MKPLTSLQNLIYQIGGILLIVGAILPVVPSLATFAPYVFTTVRSVATNGNSRWPLPLSCNFTPLSVCLLLFASRRNNSIYLFAEDVRKTVLHLSPSGAQSFFFGAMAKKDAFSPSCGKAA